MSLRITRQIVEVLATGDTKVQVSRQAVEVLVTESSSGGNEINATASNALALSSDAVGQFELNVSASSNLALVQELDINMLLINLIDFLNLVQDAEGRQIVIQESASSDLALQQSAHRLFEELVSSNLNFSQETFRHYFPTSSLALTDLADFSRELISELSLSDLAEFLMEFNRSLISEISFSQSVGYFIQSSQIECIYSPFVGTVASGVTPPSVTVPTLVKGILTLTYPYVSPTETLILRNPVFGNAHRLEYQRINRTSRGGTLLIYADPVWPKQQVLVIQVDGLKESKKTEFLQFLNLSLGKEVGLLDHESRQWKGIITTPEAAATQVDRNSYSISFEFEGELV